MFTLRVSNVIGQQLTLKTQPTLITAFLYLDQPQTRTKLCLVQSNLKMEYFILIILSKVFKSLPFIVTGRNFYFSSLLSMNIHKTFSLQIALEALKYQSADL